MKAFALFAALVCLGLAVLNVALYAARDDVANVAAAIGCGACFAVIVVFGRLP